jgi:histone H3/H4
MVKISDPACARLCKKAGIKSASKQCNDNIRNLISMKAIQVLEIAKVLIDENNTNTILQKDIYDAIRLVEDGTNMAKY